MKVRKEEGFFFTLEYFGMLTYLKNSCFFPQKYLTTNHTKTRKNSMGS